MHCCYLQKTLSVLIYYRLTAYFVLYIISVNLNLVKFSTGIVIDYQTKVIQ